jgi:hypothetical protein
MFEKYLSVEIVLCQELNRRFLLCNPEYSRFIEFAFPTAGVGQAAFP